MDLLERLEKYAAIGTPRPWRLEDGNILADVEVTDLDAQHIIDLYGGMPVAESVMGPDGTLVTDVVNHLPEIVAALKILPAVRCAVSGSTTDRCWDHPECGTWCSRCLALEPLIRIERHAMPEMTS